MLLTIRSSKTDQDDGESETLAIARGDRAEMCAARALQTWLVIADIVAGPIFRRVRATSAPSLSATAPSHSSSSATPSASGPRRARGHSLRSGGITAAAREGHSEREIARLRHTDMAVLRGYVRRASRFEDAAQVLASRRDGS